jgi:hypothetical protein
MGRPIGLLWVPEPKTLPVMQGKVTYFFELITLKTTEYPSNVFYGTFSLICLLILTKILHKSFFKKPIDPYVFQDTPLKIIAVSQKYRGKPASLVLTCSRYFLKLVKLFFINLGLPQGTFGRHTLPAGGSSDRGLGKAHDILADST